MFELSYEQLWSHGFLISSGAVLGVWSRFFLISIFSKFSSQKYWITFLINIIATFFLGLLMGLKDRYVFFAYSSEIILFIAIGFLGSFSTFSTFIFEVFEILVQGKKRKAVDLVVFSIFGGLFLSAAGYGISNG